MKVKGIYAILWALAGIGIFVGLILTDYAKHKFWWTFWEVVAIVCGICFVGAIGALFFATQGSAKKPD